MRWLLLIVVLTGCQPKDWAEKCGDAKALEAVTLSYAQKHGPQPLDAIALAHVYKVQAEYRCPK